MDSLFDKLSQDKRAKFDLLTEIMLRENAKYNLTRIAEPGEINIRHYADSLIVHQQLADYQNQLDGRAALIDIGSGAGFPGLAIAIAFDSWNITSVEATGKKLNFQKMAAAELGLKNFTAVCGRAEDLARDKKFREKFDVATARAVGHLGMIAEISLPFVKVGGLFLGWKGPKVEQEILQCGDVLAELGAGQAEILNYSLPGIDSGRIVRSAKVKNTPMLYPRPFGVIKKSVNSQDK